MNSEYQWKNFIICKTWWSETYRLCTVSTFKIGYHKRNLGPAGYLTHQFCSFYFTELLEKLKSWHTLSKMSDFSQGTDTVTTLKERNPDWEKGNNYATQWKHTRFYSAHYHCDPPFLTTNIFLFSFSLNIFKEALGMETACAWAHLWEFAQCTTVLKALMCIVLVMILIKLSGR